MFFCVAVLSLACAAQSVARTKKHPPAKPIDLNTATLNQLEELPGVGPVTAKSILDFRVKSGPFKRVEDLLSVHRISEKKLDKLRPYVTVGPAHHSSTTQAPKGSK
ncbi:MAG: ComEA family DNA-binding protein [Candidatus Acidiferrales bacterium]